MSLWIFITSIQKIQDKLAVNLILGDHLVLIAEPENFSRRFLSSLTTDPQRVSVALILRMKPFSEVQTYIQILEVITQSRLNLSDFILRTFTIPDDVVAFRPKFIDNLSQFYIFDLVRTCAAKIGLESIHAITVIHYRTNVYGYALAEAVV
jgi:hypothetical protein